MAAASCFCFFSASLRLAAFSACEDWVNTYFVSSILNRGSDFKGKRDMVYVVLWYTFSRSLAAFFNAFLDGAVEDPASCLEPSAGRSVSVAWFGFASDFECSPLIFNFGDSGGNELVIYSLSSMVDLNHSIKQSSCSVIYFTMNLGYQSL